MYLNKVLVVTDFSEDSTDSFKLAEHEARVSHSELTLLHIIEPPTIPVGLRGGFPRGELLREIEEAMRKNSSETLSKFSQKFFSRDFTPKCVSLERSGRTAHLIAHFARKNKFGLIVLAAHGKGFIQRALMGSTTEMLIRKAPCPLLVVPKHDKGSLPNGPYKRILVTTDLSEESEQAFKYAAYEAKLNSAEVLLTHACEDLNGIGALKPAQGWTGINPGDLQRLYSEQVNSRLEQYAKNHFPLAAVKTVLLRRERSVAEAVTQYAIRNKVDLTVIATAGGDVAPLLGATAERILRLSETPVLLVPHKDMPIEL